MNTWEHYYDIKRAGEFDTLFGGLAIHQMKTPNAHQYHVLPLDFSIDVGAHTPPEVVEQKLYDKINTCIHEFANNYQLVFDINRDNAVDSLERLAYTVRKKGGKLMILVDEYDRFANKLMLENIEAYKRMVVGSSGVLASSPIRGIYECFKGLSRHLGDSFLQLSTGITPIALADASGANYVTNVSMKYAMGDVVGFSREDLEVGLKNAGIVEDKELETALEVMKKHYNGYLFPGSSTPLYNPTLCNWFMQKFTTNKNNFKERILSGNYTVNYLTDSNTLVSENVLRLIEKTPSGVEIVGKLLSNTNLTVQSLHESMRLNELLSSMEEQSMERVCSYLYYHGATTLSDSIYQPESSSDPTVLAIPNEVQKEVFLRRAHARFNTLNSLILSVFNTPDFSSKSLLNALQMMVDESFIPLYYNDWNESTFLYCLQGPFAHALGKQNVRTQEESGDFNRRFEGGFIKRTDLVLPVLNNQQTCVVIELKHVPEKFLVEEVPKSGWKEKHDWLRDAEEEELLLSWHCNHASLGRISLQQLMDAALNQVASWEWEKSPLYSPEVTVRKFAALLVGSRVLLQELTG